MIKHIVFWKFKPEAEGHTADENKALVQQALLGLIGKVPSLIHLETGVDFNRSDAAWDLALYTTFEDKEGLDAYQNHPEHLKVVALVRSVVSARAVADYED